MSRIGLSAVVVLAALLWTSTLTGLGQDKKKVSNLDKVMKALPEEAPAKPKQARKILVYSKTAGFRHGSIGIGTQAITLMGDKTKAYSVLHTEDESLFEPDRLRAFDAVFMLNTTGECLRPKDGNKEREEMLKKSLHDFVSSGKGLIGVHSGTDTYRNWKDYNKMMGGAFVSHPWSAGSHVYIKNLDPKHPLNAAFDGKDFDITDEIYMFRDDTALPTERRYLLALDPKKTDVSKQKRKDGLYPISWVSTYGKGRTFYCSLGHNDHIFWNPMILKHYLAGIQYVVGDLDVETTPIAVSGKQ